MPLNGWFLSFGLIFVSCSIYIYYLSIYVYNPRSTIKHGMKMMEQFFTFEMEPLCQPDKTLEEIEELLSLTFEERKTFPLPQNSSSLSSNEWASIFSLSLMDPLPPEPIQCVDNHKLFNKTIFGELNLFSVHETITGTVLERNVDNLLQLRLDKEQVQCNFSLLKSDDDSAIDDSISDIPLRDDITHIEGPHNSIGVRCSATYSIIEHLLEKTDIERDQQEIITFYYNVFMFVYKRKLSTVEMDGPAKSVLILTIDATSRSAFSRNFPKTLKYLKDRGAVSMRKHHRQGENSYPNIISLLTGKVGGSGYNTFPKENEDHYGTMDNVTMKNKLTWAWKPWVDANLPTMWHEDMPWADLFHVYGREGWEKKNPHMFYHRSAYRMMDSEQYWIRNGDLAHGYKCIGNTPSHQRQFALLRMISKTYSNDSFFSYMHLSEYSHNLNNFPNNMDQDLADLFQILVEGGFLNKTLVIVMGDHGSRGGQYSTTAAGWLDSNTPLSLMLVPEDIKKEKPNIMKILMNNSKKLTTMQDIFHTITDPIITRQQPENNTAGFSLFHPIPSRTCKEALVDQAYCICPGEKKILNATDPSLINNIHEVVNNINRKVENYSQCEALELHHVDWGWIDEDVYHIQFFTRVQQTVEHGNKVASFHAVYNGMDVSNIDIRRTDTYRDTSKCIDISHIKPFCICK